MFFEKSDFFDSYLSFYILDLFAAPRSKYRSSRVPPKHCNVLGALASRRVGAVARPVALRAAREASLSTAARGTSATSAATAIRRAGVGAVSGEVSRFVALEANAATAASTSTAVPIASIVRNGCCCA